MQERQYRFRRNRRLRRRDVELTPIQERIWERAGLTGHMVPFGRQVTFREIADDLLGYLKQDGALDHEAEALSEGVAGVSPEMLAAKVKEIADTTAALELIALIEAGLVVVEPIARKVKRVMK